MKNILVALVIVLSLILLVGWMKGDGRDTLRISTVTEQTVLTVSVTLNHVTDAYRWLSLYGCSAEVTENGTFCTGTFERESTIELFGRKQELFLWRNMPQGTLRLTAEAFDANHRVLATGQITVLRVR